MEIQPETPITSLRQGLHAFEQARIKLEELTPDWPMALPAHVRFRVAGLPFQARVDAVGSRNSIIKLSTRIGHLPYSSEDSEARRAALDWLRKVVPGSPFQIRVEANNGVWLDQSTEIEQRPSAVDFIAILSQLLIMLLPHVANVLGHLIPSTGHEAAA